MVLRVKPTPNWFPTNILSTLAFYTKCVTPVGHVAAFVEARRWARTNSASVLVKVLPFPCNVALALPVFF